MDARRKLELQAMFRLSVDTDLAFAEQNSPLLAVLAKLRAEALDAMAALVRANPQDAIAIASLQNEVKTFFTVVDQVRGILDVGDQATEELSEEARNELREELGLPPQGAN